ncbi:molybdate ABC transporter substrate-binding protein [Prauserella cavernicola]|uniref:Molybdate-binding protein ModA n=1 Tax=Prauserella cavernicola TaxID=2800127 RepID=A0A934QNN1_9PSEU|nr:molybdate ABC transporter substrate-binding protein [Prauserella cavernicola]MBK1785377.1 molybdate ABC transporter substrate-binding protein [Prauserella cavernicola]
MRLVLAGVLSVVLVVSACGGSDGSSDEGSGGGDGNRTLNVFAAASLTEAFGELEKQFEAEHDGVDVRLNLAGSSQLASQINEGAPADVFASANEKNMDKVVEAGGVEGQPETFATNKLTIAVPPGNPKGITSFADLAGDDLTVVVCASQVPCGSATEEVEQATGVTLSPASEEQDVKAVLTKVELGEADAGLVYVTDVTSAGDKVESVEFPEAEQAINDYPIAVLAEAGQSELAQQFYDLVLGRSGQEELSKVGFGTP